jgi:hypothetical protein
MINVGIFWDFDNKSIFILFFYLIDSLAGYRSPGWK